MAANVPKQQQCQTTTAEDDRELDSEVARFYQGQVIFITGGTGFIGKVLLEKLLRSCPGLKRVYVLVRSKRGESPQARLEKIFQSEMFVHLRQEQPDAFEKVTVLAGDLKEPNLGLSASDEATLVDSVSVVFHSGATVRFDEPLKEAVQLNVLGTRRVLDLCKKMRNLCALVHVSTAYCNFDKKDVLEMVYPAPVSAEKLIESARSSGEYVADSTEGCLYGHPNTYTLTKNVAETLLQEERGDIPVAIVRPSIVTASVKEPLPGWIDNYNACTGIIVALGAGLLQSLFVDKKCVADVVPVDYVVNMIICVAWKTAQTRPKDIGVYHCTSGALKHATWGQLIEEMLRAARQYPLPNMIRFPEFHLTDSLLWHDINLWCLHYVPARIVDAALQLYGQKPRFVRYYQKARKATDPVRKFIAREWLFRPTNALSLQEELSPRDAQLFDFNVQHIEWSPYVDAYVLGIRKYLLKAEDSQLPEARKHLKRLNALRWSWYLVLTAIPCGLAANTAAWNMFSVPSFATGLRDVIGFQRLL